jgi:hypothetical protein
MRSVKAMYRARKETGKKNLLQHFRTVIANGIGHLMMLTNMLASNNHVVQGPSDARGI